MNRKEIEWLGRKAQIERDISEEYGERLIRDINQLDKEIGLTYKQRLYTLNFYMKFCNAVCLVNEFYGIQVNHILREEAKEELLNNRMTEVFINERTKND